MKTELLRQEKNLVTVKVEFEAEEFAASLDKTIQETAQKANIPGFRKGHIPRKVLEMRVGKLRLYAESFENMLPQTVEQIVADYDLETIASPSFRMEDEIGEGKPLVCEATFEVIPEVSLPELESIEVEKLRPRLTDEMFERAVRDLQAYHSTLNTVKRPVGEGDVVSATSVVFAVDSNERQKWENTPQKNVFDLAEPALRSEVKDALVGKIPGEKTSAEFVVDKAHKDKRIAGKKIHYDITIDQVEERVFPETTNEFYRQVLNVDLDSEEALREELKKRLLTQLDEEYRGQAILSAIDQIVEKSELEVPDALLSRQIQRQKQQDAEACKQRFDLDIEEYLRNASVSPADYEWEVREKSINNIRRTLVLDAMRKKFEVEVDRNDLETEIIRMANAYQTKPENIKAAYYKNQDQLRQLTDELCYLKLATVVQEKIKVKEVDELSVKTPQAAEITAAPSANSETTEKGE